MAKWQRRDLDFKRRAVARMVKSKSIAALALELGVSRTLLYQWKDQLAGRQQGKRADLSQSRQSAGEKRLLEENRRLKEVLGEKALETDFFVGALRRIEEQRRKSTVSGGTASTSRSGRGNSERKAN